MRFSRSADAICPRQGTSREIVPSAPTRRPPQPALVRTERDSSGRLGGADTYRHGLAASHPGPFLVDQTTKILGPRNSQSGTAAPGAAQSLLRQFESFSTSYCPRITCP
eukprot:767868-Hanusia_phi.AAC.2